MLNEGLSGETQINTDIVIVGSGCGGGVLAAVLAQAGHQVLVLEKGRYYRSETFPSEEAQAFEKLYDSGGAILTDSGISVLAGSTFGGGTTVNWACCLRTPHFVREEWAREHGLSFMISQEFSEAVKAVEERLSVKEEAVSHNACNRVLIDGCKALGCDIQVAPQNMRDVSEGAVDAGRISIGDRQRNKQGDTETRSKMRA